MIKFSINKKKIIPNIIQYLLIFLSSLLVYFFLKGLLFYFFPAIEKIDGFWSFFILTALIVYLGEILELKIGNYTVGNGGK